MTNYPKGIEVPIYKRKERLKLLYVNPRLFENRFGKYSFQRSREVLEEYFNITIDERYRMSDEVIGIGHVDYQEDPSGISLDGNLGSGRAYYVGSNFNIKGELTPLATSPLPIYNNGKLSLESAIHETLISNVISKEFTPATYETLAVLSLEEEYLFPGAESPMKCALMIREHKDNELYRFSHRFVNKQGFTKEELHRIAAEMGSIEGQKFIHRMIHGAWSLGNLSVDTNMIDFDTTYFLKNRNPAFSFTYKYKTNYFGEEYLGQLKILELILGSELNQDNVKLEELADIIAREQKKKIIDDFPKLMGIEIKEDYKSLVDSFIKLSKYGYECYDELYTMNPNNDSVALFNFSEFFRYYPLLIKEGQFTQNRGLELLLNGDGELNDTESGILRETIRKYFSHTQVSTDEQFIELMDEALLFIKHYDELYRRNVVDIDESLLNAYIINEDRTFLFNNQLTKYHLSDLYDSENNEVINRLMNLIIVASNRTFDREEYICDLEIRKDMYSYNLINRRDNTISRVEYDFYGNLLSEESLTNKILLKRREKKQCYRYS